MKKLLRIIVLSGLLYSCSSSSSLSESNKNNCSNSRYGTAEEGVCLDPRAYRLLKALEHINNNPFENQVTSRLIDIIEPRVHSMIDTSVARDDHMVPIRIYYPHKKTMHQESPIILFIHGGAFMYGSIEEYDMVVKKLARISNAIVISVEYSLAPEHPYPAALNDISAVLEWIDLNLEALGGKNNSICIMGDSAGANLATVTALRNRDMGLSDISCQVLFYPATTFREIEFPSRIYYLKDEQRTYLLTEELLRRTRDSYLGNTSDANPYVSPLEADLSGKIPPTLIITAQCDPLRDEGKLYAQKLQDAGQVVEYIEYEGMIHGFFNFYMLFSESKKSMHMVSKFIAQHSE